MSGRSKSSSPKWDRPVVVRVPSALHHLIENEAAAGCTNQSVVIRKALRHYFNCPHARRFTRGGKS